MDEKIPQVFLDANILIAVGKPPGGPEIARVAELVDAKMISVLTTDLTVMEVAKKHADNDLKEVKEFARAHVHSILQKITETILPVLTKEEMRERLLAGYRSETDKMFKRLGAKVLSIDDVAPSSIFNDYTRATGFFSGEGKKDQFPDAFIFERIKAEAAVERPLIVVTADGDYAAPVEREENIDLVASLPELFTKLGLEYEAPQVDAFLDQNIEALIEGVNEELGNWGLIGDVEDSEIDKATVTNLTILDRSAFKSVETDGPIVVVAKLEVDADIYYSHPDWDNASYDSEDKVLLPWDTVEGDTTVSLTVDVSISIEVDESDGSPRRFDEIRFRNDRFQYVVLHPYDHYN